LVSASFHASRVAFVHDFFVQDGGAERCATELANLLPGATVHTTFFDAATFGARIAQERVHCWPLQRVLGATKQFRWFLPAYPVWFSALDLQHAELVVSSSVAFAKAVRTSADATHVSYVYTPMRYAWDLDAYLDRSSYGLPARMASRSLRPVLKAWDRRTGRRPDVLVVISDEVRRRVRWLWGRDAQVIYPPVDTSEIPLTFGHDGYYLVAARLLAYRRIDLAVAACRRLRRELVVVGDGPERAALEQQADGASVRFMGHVPRSMLVDLFARCRAYLVPGVEDFGIAPLEAAAAGKPVIAFRGGGALETVRDGETGILFDTQDDAALAAAIERCESIAFDPSVLRAHAERFDREVFLQRWRSLLGEIGFADALAPAPAPLDLRER
jgi:glycosyltransferase involved in cell wall biosynthesis